MSHVIRRGDDGRAELVETDAPVAPRSVDTMSLRRGRDGNVERHDPCQPTREAWARHVEQAGGRPPGLHPHALGPRRPSAVLVTGEDGETLVEHRERVGDVPTVRRLDGSRVDGTRDTAGHGRITRREGPYDPATGHAPDVRPMTLDDLRPGR